jgi:hypothetical protein
MRLQNATLVSAAFVLGIVSASDSFAGRGGSNSARAGHGGGAQQRGHTAGGYSGGYTQGRYVAPYLAYSYYPRAAYAPASYYASTAPSYARPSVYFVPPISANAPLFSFDGSPAVEPDWGWQRVSLQQLAAEVRAKREAGRKP